MNKAEYLHIRITKDDKTAIEKDAEASGHDTTSAFLLWLWRQWHRKNNNGGR